MKYHAIVEIPIKVKCTFDYDNSSTMTLMEAAKRAAKQSYISIDPSQEYLKGTEEISISANGQEKIMIWSEQAEQRTIDRLRNCGL